MFESTAVELLYAVELHRAPDAAGEAYWVGKLEHGTPLFAVEAGFRDSQEFHALTDQFIGKPQDIASLQYGRTAAYTGGQPGYVNGTLRVSDTIGPNVTAFEWTATFIANNYAAAGENTALYAQGNGFGAGPTWAAVAEARAHGPGTAVGLEVDAGRDSTNGLAVGIDVVNFGNMTQAILVPEGVPALVDDAHRDTYISFGPGGSIEFYEHGVKLRPWS